MGRREIKQKAKLMSKEIEEKTNGKIFTYYDADKLVLEIIKSYLTDKFGWNYTKGIFETEAGFDCINPKYKTSFFAYEIDDMIYLSVCYEFLNLPADLKEDEEEKIKNLKVKVKWIHKPNKEDFDDRDICYKEQEELENQDE